MKDHHGREINYLRISVTDLCNLRCQYCMPEEGIVKKKHKAILSFEEIYQIAKVSAQLGIKKVRITGGEPLVRKDIAVLISQISKISGIEDIAITTNGILLEEYAAALKDAGLKRINISLDTLKADRYETITRGGDINKVMRGIEAARREGLSPIRINVVAIKGFNDDEIADLANLTIENPIDVRFIELMPIGETGRFALGKYISNEEVMSHIENLELTEQEQSVATYYKIKGAKGRVGFITPVSNHFCSRCNRVRITSDGKLKPCLLSSEEVDLKQVLDEKNDIKLKKVIENAILNKPNRHYLDGKIEDSTHRNMVEIGG